VAKLVCFGVVALIAFCFKKTVFLVQSVQTPGKKLWLHNTQTNIQFTLILCVPSVKTQAASQDALRHNNRTGQPQNGLLPMRTSAIRRSGKHRTIRKQGGKRHAQSSNRQAWLNAQLKFTFKVQLVRSNFFQVKIFQQNSVGNNP